MVDVALFERCTSNSEEQGSRSVCLRRWFGSWHVVWLCRERQVRFVESGASQYCLDI